MSRPRYGVSPWSVSSAGKARAFPAVPDLGEAEVVVIGGGLTGLLTTWGLKAAGRGAVLLEAGRLGAGDSLSASGLTGLLVTSDYRALEAMHGRRIARTLMSAVAAAGPAMLAGLKKAKAVVKVRAAADPEPARRAGAGLGTRGRRPRGRRARDPRPDRQRARQGDTGRGAGGDAAARRRID